MKEPSVHPAEIDSPAVPRAKRFWHSLSFFEFTQILSNIAVIISVLIALPLYLAQREDANQLERQQLAAEMFMRKYDEGLFNAYGRTSNAFDSRNAYFSIFAGTQEEGKKALAGQIISDAGLENIKQVVDYFDDLLVCVEQGLCDERMARSLVGRDMRNFYCKARYVGLPELRRDYDYPEYGARLERFVGDCAASTAN